MNSRHARRISTLCRQSFLALLMLCLALQPVIAGRAALHEIIDHSGWPSAHVELHEMQWQAGANDTDGDTSASHALLHHAHCCAQPQLLVYMQWQLPALKPLTRTHWALSSTLFDDRQSTTPFRPPIQA